MRNRYYELTAEMFREGIPWTVFDRLRRDESLSQMSLPDGTLAWNLVRYDDVLEGLRALHHYATPSVDPNPALAPGAVVHETADDRTIRAMNVLRPPTHTEYRQQFTGLMKRSLLEQFKLRVSRIADEAIHKVLELGVADAVEDCAGPTAAAFVCDYLGVSSESREYFRRLSAIFMGDTLPPTTVGSFETAGLRPRSLCAIHGSPARAAVELIAESWGHLPWLDGKFVDGAGHWEIEDLGMQLLTAGVAGVRSCLVSAILLLAPLWGEVKRNQDTWLSRIPVVTDEIIRHATPLLRVRRILTADICCHGQQMLAGDTVLLWLVGANFDEKRFPDPRSFLPFRTPNPHLSFGGGPHHCLGAPLAKLEVEEFLRAMIKDWNTIEICASPINFPSSVVNEVSSVPIRIS